MRLGVDTGGTFTDVVALEGGALRVVKQLSTPRDPAEAVLAGVAAAAQGGVVEEVVHGTTVATNALLERSGGPTVLVTTAGFEDVLELGRQARPKLYALHPELPPPLLDEAQRFGLDERLAADGAVLRSPSPEALRALAARVAALKVRSVAICLLHAYKNDAHEQAAAAALGRLGLHLSLSSEVLPAHREYERTSTTVVDAYVAPVIGPYLERLARELGSSRLRVMNSSGGALSAREAARQPVRTVLSGPAAGVVGAQAVARAAGLSEVVTLDMGGTSTDVALIAGEIATTDEAEVAGCPIQLPMLAVHTVGAGGGSIARVDAGGALKVGPQSAGADPGPASYARGGVLPTVTDADLVLGRLDPDGFLGGAMRLDAGRARAALADLTTRLGLDVESAAEGVVTVADTIMARAIKTISVERGHDPERFVLMPFGGAGGVHACAVARELGMTRVVVPPSPGVLCAYGALAADVRRELVRTLLIPAGLALEASALEAAFRPLEADALEMLASERVPPSRRELERACTLRYAGQSFELVLPAAGELVAGFHEAHRARYGFALPERAVELVTVRLKAVGRAQPLAPPREPLEPGEPVVARRDLRWQGRFYPAAILLRRRLPPGSKLAGPAVIVEYSATTFLPPDAQCEVDATGCLLITLQG